MINPLIIRFIKDDEIIKNRVHSVQTSLSPSLSVPQLCPPTLSVVADDRSGGLSPQGGERGLQRCPSSLSTKAQSVGTYRREQKLSAAAAGSGALGVAAALP